MKRYYICDIYGNGDIDVPNSPTTGPYRPAVADLGVSWVGAIPTGPDGRPTKTWALVLVASRDHAVVRNAPGVDSLPDFPLDGKVSSINTVTKNAMLARLTARGISRTFIDSTDGYREVIRGIGRQLEPDFDENKFDIADE